MELFRVAIEHLVAAPDSVVDLCDVLERRVEVFRQRRVCLPVELAEDDTFDLRAERILLVLRHPVPLRLVESPNETALACAVAVDVDTVLEVLDQDGIARHECGNAELELRVVELEQQPTGDRLHAIANHFPFGISFRARNVLEVRIA